MSLYRLDGITVYQLTLSTALSMGLQDVNVLNVVFRTKHSLLLDTPDRSDHQVSEEVRIHVDQLTRHRGLSTVQQSLLA